MNKDTIMQIYDFYNDSKVYVDTKRSELQEHINNKDYSDFLKK